MIERIEKLKREISENTTLQKRYFTDVLYKAELATRQEHLQREMRFLTGLMNATKVMLMQIDQLETLDSKDEIKEEIKSLRVDVKMLIGGTDETQNDRSRTGSEESEHKEKATGQADTGNQQNNGRVERPEPDSDS